MRLRFTPRAVRHLHAIADYISKDSPVAARHIGDRLREATELLPRFPELGHQGILEGTRELVVPGLFYIIVHRIESNDPDTLTILGIYHGAQLRPGQEPSAKT
jgi:addiction module RelE/StbE family toxin